MKPRISAIYALLALVFAGNSEAAPPNRIIQALRTEQTRAVRGNIHPGALVQNDQGPVDSALQMDHVLLVQIDQRFAYLTSVVDCVVAGESSFGGQLIPHRNAFHAENQRTLHQKVIHAGA